MKTQSMIAKALPCNHWRSVVTETIWHMKWTMNGLMPVRPVVVLSKGFVLQAGDSVLIDSPAET